MDSRQQKLAVRVTGGTRTTRAAAFAAHAERYSELGWALTRLEGKRPLDSEWQRTLPEEPGFAAGRWSQWGQRFNMGVVLGRSGIAVFEYDRPEARDRFLELLGGLVPKTAVCRTGSGRGHAYYLNRDEVAPATRDGLELRAGGQQCALPPSDHPETGKPYEWVNGHAPWDLELLPLPAAIIDFFAAEPNGGAAAPIGDEIGQGRRNSTLASLAGTMRRRGASEAEILAALEVANGERCRPPLDDDEVRRIARSVARYQPQPGKALSPAELPAEAPRTDLGNAEIFSTRNCHRLRHVRERRHWLEYREGRWRVDLTGEAERAAKEVARQRLRDAAEIRDPDRQKRDVRWAMTSQSGQRLREMLSVASTESATVLAADQLDTDPLLLSCANGTLDLRSGTLRDPDPDDLITLGTDIPYLPDATCPRFERHLKEVFDGDAELVDYMRRLTGYTLTGDVREQIVAVLHGTGCNGKDTLVKPIQRIVGDHAQTCAIESFMVVHNRGVRNDLAALHRARLVVASESAEGRRLDEATVKMVSGGNSITARFLYGEFFEFAPRFKVWLITNHRPRVEGDDDAIWRRLRLIPFNVSFLGREDRELDRKLEAELPGILSWAVRGCLEWQADGLGLPAAVEQATSEYRADEDVFGAFVGERCTLDGQVAPADLRTAYDQFCRALGEKPLSASVIGKRLAKRGIRRATREGENVYVGISVSS
jgi:putative DNA primase/helicase